MGYVESVKVTLDKERYFQMSFGTIRRFQKASGIKFQQLGDLMARMQSDDSDIDEGDVIDMLGTLVWAGCVAEDPSLTVDQVFDNLAFDPTEQLRPIFDAMNRAMPEATDDPLVEQARSQLAMMNGGESGISDE